MVILLNCGKIMLNYVLNSKKKKRSINLVKNFLALGALEDKFWLKFCEIIKAPQIITEEKERSNIIIKKIQKIIKSKNSNFWKNKFSKEENVCCTLVEKIDNLIKDPHLADKNLFKHKSDKSKEYIPYISTVIKNNSTILKNKRKAPLLAAHNYIINNL